MASDPSYGTTGFFSYLWVKRKPVFDADESIQLTANDGTTRLTDDSGTLILVSDIPNRLIRWI